MSAVWIKPLAVVTALAAALTVSTAVADGAPAPRHDHRPNIVFVLTDDLDSSLVRYMPHVQALAARGVSFDNYIVADSWCCPSRASILTGEFPHNTGVRNNGNGPDGGFAGFQAHGDDQRTFALRLQEAGYRTGFMGKYLNGYVPTSNADGTTRGDGTYVPPGWDEWYGLGQAYDSYGYTANHNGTLERHGDAPEDYLNTVLGQQATSFLDTSGRGDAPFLLEVASFTPHSPYTPAPEDLDSFPDVRAPRGGAWDTLPSDPPAWLAAVPPIDAAGEKLLDKVARKRVQAVQSVDRMVGALQDTLRARGELDDTVFVFSSDNGFHLGQHRLRPGKLTAYDTDIRVPLVAAGPGIPAGVTTDVLAQNVDLAPTFESLGGAVVPPTVDGRDLTTLLRGGRPADWRQRAFVEHAGRPTDDTGDPDAQTVTQGVPTPYEALRGPDWTYVQYASGETEYYDLRSDPDQLTNLAGSLSPGRRAELQHQVAQMRTCGGVTCRTAAA